MFYVVLSRSSYLRNIIKNHPIRDKISITHQDIMFNVLVFAHLAFYALMLLESLLVNNISAFSVYFLYGHFESISIFLSVMTVAILYLMTLSNQEVFKEDELESVVN